MDSADAVVPQGVCLLCCVVDHLFAPGHLVEMKIEAVAQRDP